MLLTYWETKYSQLQHDPSEAGAAAGGPKALLAYEADIGRLATLTEDVLSENAQEPVRFLSVQCTPLKQVWPKPPALYPPACQCNAPRSSRCGPQPRTLHLLHRASHDSRPGKQPLQAAQSAADSGPLSASLGWHGLPFKQQALGVQRTLQTMQLPDSFLLLDLMMPACCG